MTDPGMTSAIYICSRRGTLHLAARTFDGRLLSDERCNLDDARVAWALPNPTGDFKRKCKRCFQEIAA